jgi:hypothetical protein
MNTKPTLPTRLILGTLLMAGFIAPPHAVPQTQDTSNASLAETLSWIASFLPGATGAPYNGGGGLTFTDTAQLEASNTCTITLVVVQVVTDASPGHPRNATMTNRYNFSLADIDQKSIQAYSGDYTEVQISSPTRSIRETDSFINNNSGANEPVDLGGGASTAVVSSFRITSFNDQAGGQRVANAFQHAANLCANASPF